MGVQQPVVFEELLVAIDLAGRLQGDTMKGVGDPQSFVPEFAHGVERVAVLALSNGDQLGASLVYAILQGPGFPDGPHQILCGGHGGENIDLANEGAPPTVLEDMGIVCKPDAEYEVFFQSVGDTMDEFGCSIEITFDADAVREPKAWIASSEITAAVDTNVQGANLASSTQDVATRGSKKIGGVILGAAGDMAALGVNHVVCLMSVATKEDIELICGGVGGELVVGSGAHIPPSQRVNCNFELKSVKKNVFVEFRGVIEAGVILGGVSIGFVI